MIWNQTTPPIQENPDVAKLPAAFVGKSGRLYIRQRRTAGPGYHNRCTVWESLEAYNNRIRGPLTFVDASDALADFSYEVTIQPQSLKAVAVVHQTNEPVSTIDRAMGGSQR